MLIECLTAKLSLCVGHPQFLAQSRTPGPRQARHSKKIVLSNFVARQSWRSVEVCCRPLSSGSFHLSPRVVGVRREPPPSPLLPLVGGLLARGMGGSRTIAPMGELPLDPAAATAVGAPAGCELVASVVVLAAAGVTAGATRDIALHAAAASSFTLPATLSPAAATAAVSPRAVASMRATAVSVAALSPVPLVSRLLPVPSPPTPLHRTAIPGCVLLPAAPIPGTRPPAALPPVPLPSSAPFAAEPEAGNAARVCGQSAVSLRTIASAAGNSGAAHAAAAASSAVAAGRRAGDARVSPLTGEVARSGAESLEADLHCGVGAWTGSSRGTPYRSPGAGSIAPVPTQVLQSSETTRATL